VVACVVLYQDWRRCDADRLENKVTDQTVSFTPKGGTLSVAMQFFEKARKRAKLKMKFLAPSYRGLKTGPGSWWRRRFPLCARISGAA
jgi:hypothetical protein